MIVGTALVGLLGVLLLPDAALLWMVFLGIGQGGALGLGADPAGPARPRPGPGGGNDRDGDGRRLPDRRAAGPALVGAVRDATGDWTAPMIVLIVMTALEVPAAAVRGHGRPAPSR